MKKSLLVIGDVSLETLNQKFNINTKVEPYIKYKFEDREMLWKNRKDIFQGLINTNDESIPENVKTQMKDFISEIENSEDPAFYHFNSLIKRGNICKIDENGNALTDENPNGKFISLSDVPDERFALFFLLKNGTQSYDCVKSDVDWEKLDKNPQDVNYYSVMWDLVKGDREPQNDIERRGLNNLMMVPKALDQFTDSEQYSKFSSSFAANSVTDGEMWEESDFKHRFNWTIEFCDKYIKKLPEDTRLRILTYDIQ